MSKAYKCDNCLEVFEGSTEYTSEDGMLDFCPSCIRAMRVLGRIEPFALSLTRQDAGDMGRYDHYTDTFVKNENSL